DPFADPSVTSVEFVPGGDLTLVAGTPHSISAVVSPAGVHVVRFALVQQNDAFLSDDVVTTGEDGIAQTDLTVLSASSGFAVRAASGSAFSFLHVVSLQANLGSLIIEPQYSGHRTVQHWVASVHVGQSCNDLQGPPYPDGPSPVTSADSGAVQLNRVPADSPLAVVIRAEQFAGGCRSIASLSAGRDTVVDVDIIDRPLQIANLNLQLSFSVDAAPDVNPALDELAFRAVTPLTGTASDDLAALLDAMSGLATDSAAFEQARTSRNWRTVLVNGLDPSLPGSGLRTLLHGWMHTGLSDLSQSNAIQATLGAPDAQGNANLTFKSVLGLSPAAAGFPASDSASLSAETDDLLRVGATFSWLPSPFLAAEASAVAMAEDPDNRSSASDGMAAVFGCPHVADLLVGAGASPDEAYPGCDQTCILDLCRGAMGVLWSRVEGSNLPAVPWQVSAGAHAVVDANAQPNTVSGNWVGSLTIGGTGTGTGTGSDSTSGDSPIQGLIAGSAVAP
ncbi:MAG TPA: hypothetical protein VG963_32045, partial [Polyangiaceae bacterium]|nr:hypothetical protein [Polyangiaceae bacterium]